MGSHERRGRIGARPHLATVAIREVYVARATVVEIETAAGSERSHPRDGIAPFVTVWKE